VRVTSGIGVGVGGSTTGVGCPGVGDPGVGDGSGAEVATLVGLTSFGASTPRAAWAETVVLPEQVAHNNTTSNNSHNLAAICACLNIRATLEDAATTFATAHSCPSLKRTDRQLPVEEMTMKNSGPTMTFRLGVLALSTMMLVALLVPVGTTEADASSPCPAFAIQDVFDDPNGNWDGDLVNNSDELYNGLNPCIVDTAAFCNGGGNALCLYPSVTYYHHNYSNPCSVSLNSYPNADYDGDGISNIVEWNNHADPCKRPCPYPTNADLALNPNGSWDNDGISNAIEVNQGTNPCTSTYHNPCPYYSASHISSMPSSDWDGDGYTNAEEHRLGYNPCKRNVVYTSTHTTTYTTTNRLPHVNSTTGQPVYAAPKPVAVAPICPTGYPYYHQGNGLCYSAPVGYGWR